MKSTVFPLLGLFLGGGRPLASQNDSGVIILVLIVLFLNRTADGLCSLFRRLFHGQGKLLVGQGVVDAVAHQHQLGGGGAAVDAKVGIPAIPCDVLPRNIGAAVALYKLVVLLLIGKQRLQILGGGMPHV